MASISSRQAAEALERYGLAGAQVELLSDVDCAVFRVRVGNGARILHGSDAVLKIYPGHKGDRDAVEAEVDWLQSLTEETTLRVPGPLRALDGSIIQQIDRGSPEGRLCALFTWVAGQSCNRDLEPGRMRHIGRFVGRLHQHSEGWNGPSKLRLQRRTYTRRMLAWVVEMEAPQTVGAGTWDIAVRAATRLRQEIADIGDAADVHGFIHSDLHISNLLFDRDTVGAIDFSDCAWGHYADDIASVLVFLKHPFAGNADHSAVYGELQDAFFAGYRESRPLPSHLESSLETYFAARILLLLAYVHQAVDTVPWVPECIVNCREYLQNYLGRV